MCLLNGTVSKVSDVAHWASCLNRRIMQISLPVIMQEMNCNNLVPIFIPKFTVDLFSYLLIIPYASFMGVCRNHCLFICLSVFLSVYVDSCPTGNNFLL